MEVVDDIVLRGGTLILQITVSAMRFHGKKISDGGHFTTATCAATRGKAFRGSQLMGPHLTDLGQNLGGQCRPIPM